MTKLRHCITLRTKTAACTWCAGASAGLRHTRSATRCNAYRFGVLNGRLRRAHNITFCLFENRKNLSAGRTKTVTAAARAVSIAAAATATAAATRVVVTRRPVSVNAFQRHSHSGMQCARVSVVSVRYYNIIISSSPSVRN